MKIAVVALLLLAACAASPAPPGPQYLEPAPPVVVEQPAPVPVPVLRDTPHARIKKHESKRAIDSATEKLKKFDQGSSGSRSSPN